MGEPVSADQRIVFKQNSINYDFNAGPFQVFTKDNNKDGVTDECRVINMITRQDEYKLSDATNSLCSNTYSAVYLKARSHLDLLTKKFKDNADFRITDQFMREDNSTKLYYNIESGLELYLSSNNKPATVNSIHDHVGVSILIEDPVLLNALKATVEEWKQAIPSLD